jgi:hypothetical protein
MTVALQVPFNSYVYSSTAIFPYTFQLDFATDLVVTRNGVTKVLNTDYVVTSGLGVQAGGTITYLTALVAGDIVNLRRSIPLSRSFDYIEGGTFLADAVDVDIDRVVKMIQDSLASATVAGSIITYVAGAFLNLTDTFTAYTGRAGQFLKVNGGETGITSGTIPGLLPSGAIPSKFTDLTDTQPNYTGAAGKAVVVNSGATGLTFDGYPLGDGTWNLGSNLVIGAASTLQLVYTVAENNNLQRGTFDLGTGKYTSAAGGRVQIIAQAGGSIPNACQINLSIRVNGIVKANSNITQGVAGTVLVITPLTKQLVLGAGDVVDVVGNTSAAGGVTIDALAAETFLSIIELQ